MSMIPEEKVREVRERAPILEVISEYMSLRKSGANYQGLCPFHGEKTPSFNVNPARGIFHCFGCGVGGNVISFVMRMEGMSFPGAVRFLAKRVGVDIPERPLTREEKRQVDELELLYGISEMAAHFYRRVLESDEAGEAGRRYLERRGVDKETAAAYRMGFAPAGWDGLTKFLERKGVALPLAEKLGLVRKSDGGKYYDTFRNRLLFTIADLHGRPIGFGGRVMDDSLPKYINSPESPIYHKSEVLFGLDLAKKGVRETGSVIIVEGYFDHLALYRAGYTNVVATCGTALTTPHLKVLRRYAEKVYTLFDGDEAGRKATFRSMELFLEDGMPAKVVQVPDGDDPDDFVKERGADAFGELLDGALPIFEFYYRDLLKRVDAKTVEGKVAFIDEVAPRLMKMANPVERSLYEKEVCRAVGIDLRTLHKRMGVTPEPVRAPVRPAPRPVREKPGGGIEETLLSLMVKFPEVAERVAQQGVETLFSPAYAELAGDIVAQRGHESIDVAQVVEKVANPQERARLFSLFVADAHLEGINPLKAFEECRLALQRGALKGVKELARELATVEPESPRYAELLAQIDLLRNKKSKLP
ncbi:DNA primase [Geomonas sp. RF6]|uniref:DNA primase n=1 Tax=Geomonas sp. RF6 TaxID=2897342 RepID=UPI001E4E2BAD|nr:DNA primase [Geomonas sp. RF6]UFS72463.1 DNA primase [Geomonas sp. RF6]